MASTISTIRIALCELLFAWLVLVGSPAVAEERFGRVGIGEGVTLHYAEAGRGAAVVFVHGSLSDYSYWGDQVVAFSKRYRAIAYSRRYNPPNDNPPQPGYSAITDADDLAAFIQAQHLRKVYVIGHSYGALTALFLAIRHPELIRAMVLAEPPAVPLLKALSGPGAALGRGMYADIQRRMVQPMRADFARGQREAGVAAFIDYVFHDRHAWEEMRPRARAETMHDAHEWDVMLTRGTLFPPITPEEVRRIRVPTLIMTGSKSYPFLRLIDQALANLIPGARQVTYPGAGHQMWYQNPDKCRADAEQFFALHPG